MILSEEAEKWPHYPSEAPEEDRKGLLGERGGSSMLKMTQGEDVWVHCRKNNNAPVVENTVKKCCFGDRHNSLLLIRL